jgi:uncharacterized protein (TIGR02266 family)
MLIKEPKNILVAGDSVFFRGKLSNILSEVGHKVCIGRSGREVLDKIKEASDELDLLMLDMQNIDINGYEVLEYLKGELAVKPSTLAITGVYDLSCNLERLKELGVNGIITKGFSPEQIVFRVNSLLFGEKVFNRHESRVPVSMPLDFSIGDESHTSFLLNISASGLFLYTKKELLLGTSMLVKFVLPGGEGIMDLKGTVTRMTKPGGGEDYFYGAGVCFTSISDEDKESIRRFVQEELKKYEDSETLLSD